MRVMKFRPRERQGNRPGLLGAQRGQTLIEVLVALAILGVVIVAFLTALTTGYLTVVVADKDTRAESLTRTEFEIIRNTPYSSDVSAFLLSAGGPFPKPAGVGTNPYMIDVTATKVGNPPPASPILEITVTISLNGQTLLTTKTYKVEPNKSL